MERMVRCTKSGPGHGQGLDIHTVWQFHRMVKGGYEYLARVLNDRK
jgi:hypothetical protein